MTNPEKESARSLMYLLLRDALEFPDENVFDRITSNSFWNEIMEVKSILPYHFPFTDEIFTEKISFEEFQSDYINAFEVGPGGPPCPLYEGLYYPDRRKVMEELVRFYEHFSLTVNQSTHELPDHITVELEFMHYLTFMQVDAIKNERNPSAYLKAQKDFLERHLMRWIPKLKERTARVTLPSFYIHIISFLNEFIHIEHKYLSGCGGLEK